MPISVHTGVEFWMITALALMMGSLGTAELAGHQIALVLAASTYMVALGISGAAAARVGENAVTLRAQPFTVYHELEAAYLGVGEAAAEGTG